MGNFDADEFWKSRDFKTSARLHMQHWLFQGTLGFLLEPSITNALLPYSGRSLRIADLGCGNGAWLCELSKELGGSAELYGFDIQPSHFPAQAFLPGGVNLIKQDIINPSWPASDLAGSFDIVHVRAFASSIRNNDTGPILDVALRLLKPGGWLQWEETPLDTMIGQSPSEGVSKESIDTLLAVIRQGGKASGTLTDWYSVLDRHFIDRGFTNVILKDFPLKPQHYKAWTDDYLLVWEDIAYLLPLAAQAPNAPLTREMYQAMFEKVLADTTKGAVAHSQKVSMVVGKKP